MKKNVESVVESVVKSEEMEKGENYSELSYEDINKYIQETLEELKEYKKQQQHK